MDTVDTYKVQRAHRDGLVAHDVEDHLVAVFDALRMGNVHLATHHAHLTANKMHLFAQGLPLELEKKFLDAGGFVPHADYFRHARYCHDESYVHEYIAKTFPTVLTAAQFTSLMFESESVLVTWIKYHKFESGAREHLFNMHGHKRRVMEALMSTNRM